MRRLVLLALVPLLAGCFGQPTETDQGGTGREITGGFYGALTGDAPPGCDATRPAIAHGPDGVDVSWSGPVGIPCLVVTAWGTGEPSIGLTSGGTLFLYPTFQAPNEATSDAEQFTGLAMARSLDEGETFTRQFSEVGPTPANFHPYTADPFMYVDPYTDRVFMEDLAVPPFNCANLSYSDDDGETWTQTLGGCMVWDHVGYGSGPPIVSDPSWPVVIQRCAITLFATTIASEASGCQKTLDGGMTWQPPGDPAFFGGPDGLPYVPGECHGAVHHVFVDHRGWTWLGRDWCGTGPWIALSKDEGATWEHLHVHEKPLTWHDVGVGVDSAGTAYAFWISSDDRPMLAVSEDDGATWSEPWDIAPPGLLTAGNANIAPGGAGKAGFSYAGTFEGMEGVHAVLASGFGLGTGAPVFVTGVPGEPINDGECGGGLCDGQADFLDASVGPDGTVWGSYAVPNLAGGRLWGAPSLWDESDPNGVYGGWEGFAAPDGG